MAGDLVRESGSQQSAPHLSGRHAAPGEGGADGSGQAVAAVQLVHASGGGTRLQPLLRSIELEAPIANIPYTVIAAFLSRPGVLTKSQAEAAPYVLALRDRHMIAGDRQRHLRQPPEGRRGRALQRIARRRAAEGSGRPRLARLSRQLRRRCAGHSRGRSGAGPDHRVGARDPRRRRTDTGDHGEHRRFPAALAGRAGARAHPRRRQRRTARRPVPGGRHQSRQPATGSNLAMCCGSTNRRRRCATDVRASPETAPATHFRDTRLPVESVGSLLVFRVFERVSYALVATDTSPLSVGDQVVTP